jgi:hypothetical protein
MGETQVWGLPRTEHRIRTLAPDGLDAYGFGIPDVENNTRYLGASSVNPNLQFGRCRPRRALQPHLHARLTGRRPSSATRHRVRNRTPELRPNWADTQVFGHNAIHLGYQTYAMQGFSNTVWGRATISERTQRPVAARLAVAALRHPPEHLQRHAGSAARRASWLTTSVYDHDHFGSPTSTWNSIYPSGAVMTLFGAPDLRANSCRPRSFWEELNGTGQFGTPSLNADADHRSRRRGGGRVRRRHIPARMDPFTIYATLQRAAALRRRPDRGREPLAADGTRDAGRVRSGVAPTSATRSAVSRRTTSTTLARSHHRRTLRHVAHRAHARALHVTGIKASAPASRW